MMPDSQESFVSASSSTFAVPRLLSSSSNISNSTGADTEFPSPTSSNGPSSQSQTFDSSQPIPPSPNQTRPQHSKPTAPMIDTDLRDRGGSGSGGTATSPMSVDTPLLTQGSKRTASGTVKTTISGVMENPMRAPPGRHSRNTSVDSNASRIGELSAQLKTRLSYAMVKVQNGWERHTIEELEELPSQRGSPVASSVNADAFRRSLDSPRISDRGRRPSGVSENSDQHMASPGHASPTGISRSLSGTPSSFWRPGSNSQPAAHTHFAFTASPAASSAPALAPAADIVSRRNRRSNSTHAPPMLSTTHRKHYSDLGGMPTTPTTGPRAGILRMPSQQAEKDAVDTLLFMSSPNNSGRLAHTSADAQPSPLKSEFPVTKRVVFESRNGSSSEPDEGRTAGQSEGQNSRYKMMAYSTGATAIESDDETPFQPRKR